MGAVKTSEQVGQNGEKTSNLLLEITYGGKESPFGGMDTSAPPAYIDPTCFAEFTDSFLVIDNRLVVISPQLYTTPTLWSGTSGVRLIGFGTFYNSLTGQLNYALGYVATAFGTLGTTPTGVHYIFYMTSWNPENVTEFWNDTLKLSLYDAEPVPQYASIELDCIATNTVSSAAGSSAIVTITGPGSGGEAVDNIVLSTSNLTVSGGINYTVGEYLSIVQNTTAPNPSGFNGTGVVQVTSIGGGGAITGWILINPGYGYVGRAGVPIPANVQPITPSYSQLTVTNGSTSNTYSVSNIDAENSYSRTSTVSGLVALINGNSSFGNITALVITVSGGTITNAEITGGANLVVGQYITLLPTPALPGLTPEVIQVDTIGGGGSLETYTVTSPGTGGYVVGSQLAAYNDTADPFVAASTSIDGYSIILTSKIPGTGGNTISILDSSFNTVTTLPPAFYFSCLVATKLEGGQISGTSTAPLSFSNISTAEVGGTLYIGNLGPMILQFSGTGLFTTSTLYNGMTVLRKFAGSLIGLGLAGQLGTFTQDENMIFAWTAAGDLNTWAPETTSGDITGAGFAQLADIGDYLAGLIVSNNTAFIIRSQGISYATALGSGTDPFQFAHIGLGDRGEGAQSSALVCQYDQTGAFVGNSNVYQISNSISPIGDKIKSRLFSELALNLTSHLSANACSVFLGGDIFPLIQFLLSDNIFMYNGNNQTWMHLSLDIDIPNFTVETILLGNLAQQQGSANSSNFDTGLAIVATQYFNSSSVLQVPSFYSIVDGVPNVNTLNEDVPIITFPQEELVFGRDVTIDALYIALNADVSENVTLNWFFNGAGFATTTLTPAQFNAIPDVEHLDLVPIELQVFPNVSSTSSGVFTAHSPQLQLTITPLSDTGTAQVWITKIQIYGSFDPMQRPV